MSVRPCLIALGLAVLPVPLRAQQSPLKDVVPERPVKVPTRKQLDHLEAVKLYGRAAQHVYRNELPEALKVYEKALRLDPDSVAVRRAMLPLYAALDRQQDVLDCCHRVLQLEPGDYDTWYLYARQLRSLDRDKEARAALEKAMACTELKERPDVHLSIAYDLGTLYEKEGAFDKAESAFREVAALLEHPGALVDLGPLSREDLASQAAEAYERIGRLCLKAGRPDRAVKAFETAQKRDPGRAARLSFNLAEVLISQGKPAEALRHLDQYLARQPQGTEGYELKIKLLRKLDRGDGVVAALERYAEVDRFNDALRLLLAREYRAAGQLEKAEHTYKDLLASRGIEAYRGLFAVYRDEGEPGLRKLLDRLNEAVVAATPDNEKKAGDPAEAAHARAMLAALREDRELVKALLPVVHGGILKGRPLSYHLRVLLGVLAERTGQLDVAEQLYRSCLDKEGRVRDFGVRRQSEAEVYAGLLLVLHRARKHEEVIRTCKQGLEHALQTNWDFCYSQMAFAQMALGRTKEALEAIGKAVDSSSTDKRRVAFRCDRAHLLALAQRFDEAVAECKALLKEQGERKEKAAIKEVRFRLSAVYSLASKQDKSEEQLQKILAEEPDDAHANNDLGYLWADRNQHLEEAERLIRKALELDQQQRNSNDALGVDSDRDNAAYVDSLGWVLFRRGKLKEARRQLEKATALPDGVEDPVVWDHLGDVYFRLEDDRRAADAWRKALKLYEDGIRPKADGRQKDIEQKLKQLETSAHHR
ncbi:MAG: tetratricopeptide repeat protein [Planctomycetes bacterium]|nr:tetratricopeptide repeat protein [Planctomycetota bacterium]